MSLVWKFLPYTYVNNVKTTFWSKQNANTPDNTHLLVIMVIQHYRVIIYWERQDSVWTFYVIPKSNHAITSCFHPKGLAPTEHLAQAECDIQKENVCLYHR